MVSEYLNDQARQEVLDELLDALQDAFAQGHAAEHVGDSQRGTRDAVIPLLKKYGRVPEGFDWHSWIDEFDSGHYSWPWEMFQ